MSNNKRTINSSLFEKISMQAEEAELLGLEKIARSLSAQLEKFSDKIRKDDEFYSYAKDELKEDVEGCLWDAAMRVADFYNVAPGEQKIQELIDEMSEWFINAMESTLNISDGVGAYEPTLPGEEKKVVVLEVSEE